MPSPLPEGIYEHLLTQLLERDVAAAAPARSEIDDIARTDLPAWLARHFARELEGALRDAPNVEEQLAIAHGLLAHLAELLAASAISRRVVMALSVTKNIAAVAKAALAARGATRNAAAAESGA